MHYPGRVYKRRHSMVYTYITVLGTRTEEVCQWG